MSAREPRFEIVRSHAGWFARFVAANGRKVWQTEVYQRRAKAANAVFLIDMACAAATPEVREVDERTFPPLGDAL